MYWPSPDDVIANPRPTSRLTKTLHPRVNQQLAMPFMTNYMEDVQPQNFLLWPVGVRNRTNAFIGPYLSFPKTMAESALTVSSFLPG